MTMKPYKQRAIALCQIAKDYNIVMYNFIHQAPLEKIKEFYKRHYNFETTEVFFYDYFNRFALATFHTNIDTLDKIISQIDSLTSKSREDQINFIFDEIIKEIKESIKNKHTAAEWFSDLAQADIFHKLTSDFLNQDALAGYLDEIIVSLKNTVYANEESISNPETTYSLMPFFFSRQDEKKQKQEESTSTPKQKDKKGSKDKAENTSDSSPSGVSSEEMFEGTNDIANPIANENKDTKELNEDAADTISHCQPLLNAYPKAKRSIPDLETWEKERRLKRSSDIPNKVKKILVRLESFPNSIQDDEFTFTELESAVNAIGGKLDKKTGSSKRRICLPCFGKSGEIIADTHEPLYGDVKCFGHLDVVHRGRGAHRSHKVMGFIAEHFRGAFRNAGFNAKELWPEEFVTAGQDRRSKGAKKA